MLQKHVNGTRTQSLEDMLLCYTASNLSRTTLPCTEGTRLLEQLLCASLLCANVSPKVDALKPVLLCHTKPA
jgi:hypothetical protein